jgi:predicted RecB family nuclease
MPQYHLSKSRFVAGWQCHKLLWWKAHEPDAPELVPDVALQARLDQGIHVGEIARDYVTGGLLIGFPYYERDNKVRATADAIRNGAEIIYEASFVADGVFVAVDILEKMGKGWNLIEVKSTTKAKPEHISDVAVQGHVLKSAGLKVNRAFLMHINRECRYPDLGNLFSRTGLTTEAEDLLPSIPSEIKRQMRMLKGSLPEIARGPHCTDPHDCPFLSRCWADLPEHHITTLYRIGKKAFDLEEEGIRTTLNLPSSYPLSDIAERQRRSVEANSLIVERGLKRALNAFTPPVAYLDFETAMPAIPVWNGCRPYDAVPVQFSCHVKGEDGALTHHEWLAKGADDPREELARQVIDACRGTKTIVTYHVSTERRCLEVLQEAAPHLADPLQDLIDRLEDLLPIVRNHVYHPDFHGSFSIKDVLPAVVPDLSYDAMEVAEGLTASVLLERLLLDPASGPEEDRDRTRVSLLRYCELDTLAMVKLHERLLKMIGA